MKLSIKEIQSRFDSRFIQITHVGWVHLRGYSIGRLLVDSSTGKMYFRVNVHVSNTQIRLYQKDFLAKFRYTQQLLWYNRRFETFGRIVELHGFIEDM